MTKSNTQAQKDFRDNMRKAGLYEVRPIFAPKSLHERIKAYAKRLIKREMKRNQKNENL